MTTYSQPQPSLHLPRRAPLHRHAKATRQATKPIVQTAKIEWPLLCASLLICVCLLALAWFFSQDWQVSGIGYAEPRLALWRSYY